MRGVTGTDDPPVVAAVDVDPARCPRGHPATVRPRPAGPDQHAPTGRPRRARLRCPSCGRPPSTPTTATRCPGGRRAGRRCRCQGRGPGSSGTSRPGLPSTRRRRRAAPPRSGCRVRSPRRWRRRSARRCATARRCRWPAGVRGGVREDVGGEGADGVGGDHREGDAGGHGEVEDAVPKRSERPAVGVVLHQRGRAEDGPGQAEGGQVPLDAALALEVGDAGRAVGVGGGGEDDVPDAAARAGGVEQGGALVDLGARVAAERGGHREQCAGAVQRRRQRGGLVEVGADHFCAECGECGDGRGAGVAGEGADRAAGAQQGAGGGAALGAGGTGDGNGKRRLEYLRHADNIERNACVAQLLIGVPATLPP